MSKLLKSLEIWDEVDLIDNNHIIYDNWPDKCYRCENLRKGQISMLSQSLFHLSNLVLQEYNKLLIHSKLSRNQKNIKKHEKYCHSIKVGTLGGHNPLCLKSYKVRTPTKIFKKPNFKMK